MGSSRSFRDAFKKAMTVRSPVLTSTSSGMGTLSNASSSSLTFMSELGLEPLLIETKQGEEAVQEEEDGKESEEIWGTRTSLTDILGEDRSNILANEIDQGGSTTKAKVKVKREILDDAMSGILYDVQKDDIANTSTKMMNGLKVETTNSTRQQIIQASDGVTVLDEEEVEGNRAKEKEKRQQEACPSMPSSVMQTSTGSIAGLNKCSTSQASSPVQTFSRSPSMSPSPSPSYLSLSHNQEEHVTAHDISLMTASFGALTPLEIQNRFYAQKQQQQQRRRRNSRRKSIISKSRSNYHQSLTAPNIPTVFDPTKVLALRHQFRQHQSGAEPSIHPFDRPLQAAAQGLSISEVSKSPELKSNPGLGKGTSSLPSYYYLPPSAFRMAADVEAEERQEAEQKRQEKDKELEEYFVFLSPML
ncbi:hypothetical protein BGZ49_000701 [Haplosporangium sp. Z 27]|nr:hypothetical protein BGZ49_000701 [Haplosporangium sp. Z 27]